MGGVLPVIFGAGGAKLSDDERAFFREVRPWGFIIFERNVETPSQLRALTEAMREAVGHDAAILTDQEGGRVARLKPPHWGTYPSARHFGKLYEKNADQALQEVASCGAAIGEALASVGINVNCAPVLDAPVRGADPIIGDRAYGEEADMIAALGRAFAEAHLKAGVLPVLKHMPGHGRAPADSHKKTPFIDETAEALEKSDFLPFRALKEMPLGMTAHCVYREIDPDRPATVSPLVIEKAIRERIGFDGLLMTDAIEMEALSGSLGARAEASLRSGCDMVLSSSGLMKDMEEIASRLPLLAGESERRAAGAMARLASLT